MNKRVSVDERFCAENPFMFINKLYELRGSLLKKILHETPT
jgi:hypothetical protein